MVEFLQKKKAGTPGRHLLHHDSFPVRCETGPKRGVRRRMLAYNELGFHLLSYSPPPGRHLRTYLAISRKSSRSARAGRWHHDHEAPGRRITLPREGVSTAIRGRTTAAAATDVLQQLLASPEVTCVVPSTSIDRRAGRKRPGRPLPAEIAVPARQTQRADQPPPHRPLQPVRPVQLPVQPEAAGIMDVPRGYVAKFPSETFETWDAVEYFRLHPKKRMRVRAPDVTCSCPAGIDIREPDRLFATQMTDLRDRGLVPAPETAHCGGGAGVSRPACLARASRVARRG